MKQRILFTLVLAALALACQKQKASEETSGQDSTSAAPVTLSLKWQTDTLLTTCESVYYDKDRDVLYVSDINGAPDAKDGNGFISKVSLDGKVEDAQWVKGMDAPKGMGLVNQKLYVADIDRVHEIDVTSGKITKTYNAEGAKFLNDITTDSAGRVYISDTDGGKIFLIENGNISVWLDNVNAPNGLLAEDNRMMMASWNGKSLNTIDLNSKQVTIRTDSIDNPDGIEAIGNDAYFVSSWNGMVHYVDADWKETLVLDTRTDSVSAADIEYIKEKNLLLVPAFFKNKVMAYEVKIQQ